MPRASRPTTEAAFLISEGQQMPTELANATRPELMQMLTQARIYWTEARQDGNHTRRKSWSKAIDTLLDQLNDRP